MLLGLMLLLLLICNSCRMSLLLLLLRHCSPCDLLRDEFDKQRAGLAEILRCLLGTVQQHETALVREQQQMKTGC